MMNGLGCTSFSWSTKDRRNLLGRTYDMFGNLDANRISVVNEGYGLSLSPDGSRKVAIRRPFLSMSVVGTTASPVFVDGINIDGLMGCLLNFPGFGCFDTNKEDDCVDIYPGSFLGYILGTCSSVDEAVRVMKKVNMTSEKVYGSIMSVHYIFSDRTGETIVVEPVDGGLAVHRNTIGVMANSPDYMWQMTNLRNYIAISPVHTPPSYIAGEEFSAIGEGTGGMFGLPGGYSSPSRFVRIALAKTFCPMGSDETDGVRRMFQAFSCVTIPEGFLRRSPESEDSEQTLCTSVMCSESMTYYFSPFTDRRITAIRLQDALSGHKDPISYIDIPRKEDISFIS